MTWLLATVGIHGTLSSAYQENEEEAFRGWNEGLRKERVK